MPSLSVRLRDAERGRAVRRMQRRILFATALSVSVFVLSVVELGAGLFFLWFVPRGLFPG